MGSFIFLAAQYIRIQFLQEYAFHFYVLLLLMIILTYFMPIIGGSQRWIQLGSLSFQPSEIGKLIVVFSLARFISDNQGKMDGKIILIIGLLIVSIPGLLIFQQPDFGTAIVYILTALPMLYWGGMKPFYIFSFL